MSKDKFDNIPRIVLDKDDRDSFRGRSAPPGKVTDDVASVEAAPVKSVGSGWGVTAFILVLFGFGGSYYLYQQSELQQAQLHEADLRIQELERRLSATGEELDQSAVALRVQVTELKEKTDVLWDEMDKLWASAWRRNQSELKDLDAKVTRNFNSQKQLIEGLEGEVSMSSTNMVVLQEQVDQQLARAQQLTASVESVVTANASTDDELRSMTDQLATAALRIEALVERVNSLESLREQLNRRPQQQPGATAATPPATDNTGAGNNGGQG